MKRSTNEAYYFLHENNESAVFHGGWSKVVAPDISTAKAAYAYAHPPMFQGCRNYLEICLEKDFIDTDIYRNGNYGEFLQETIMCSIDHQYHTDTYLNPCEITDIRITAIAIGYGWVRLEATFDKASIEKIIKRMISEYGSTTTNYNADNTHIEITAHPNKIYMNVSNTDDPLHIHGKCITLYDDETQFIKDCIWTEYVNDRITMPFSERQTELEKCIAACLKPR